jgi:DNA-binding MarR family transcriptional regulator
MFIMSPTKVLTEVIRDWSESYMKRSMHDFKQFMEATGLSFSQISILMRLYHEGNRNVSEIGEQLGVTNAGASQAVDRLVGMGLIVRTENPEDRRTKRLALTAKGKEAIEGGIEARGKWIERVTDSLDSDQVEMIITALSLLTEVSQKLTE